MNEILLNILSVIVTTILLPLISLIGAKLIRYLSNKIKNDKASQMLKMATEIVINAIKTVFQTYVDALKKEEKFDKESQVITFQKAKTVLITQMTDNVKRFIESTYGNLDIWIDTQIESTINNLKTKRL